MAGKGFAPKTTRRRRNAPARGEWRASGAIGWQHGPIPEPPKGLLTPSLEAWSTWFGGWVAGHWGPQDLPGLRIVVLLYDRILRGELQRTSELRLWLSEYGLNPSGIQSRRWVPSAQAPTPAAAPTPSEYARLHVRE